VLLTVEGWELPGRGVRDFEGRTGILVGVQRRGAPADVLDPQPWDASRVAWTLECTVDERGDVRGPYVDGRPGGRFVYLSWGTQEPRGFAMFRRAKLMLADVPAEVLQTAREQGRLVARLGLTEAKGGPLCAAVRPPAIAWTAG